MPVYEYECRKCGVFEVQHGIKDEPRKRCPKCRCKVERLISANNFALKGKDWFSTGTLGVPTTVNGKRVE